MEAVAAELRAELARQKSLTQRSLAAASKVPVTTLSNSLNAKRQIDMDELGRICAGLRVTPSEIFRRVEVRFDPDPAAASSAASLAGRKSGSPQARGRERY